MEELLGVVNEEAAMDIEIYKISGFKGHPFKVVDDEKMQELVESIKVNGVLLLTSHFFPTHTLLLAKTKGFKVFC